MILENFYMQGTIVAVVIILYTFFVFELGDTFLQNACLKKICRIPLGILNVGFAMLLTLIPNSTSTTGYLFYVLIICIEFILFYRDKILRIIALVLSYTLNIVSVRAICVSVCSMITGLSIYELLQDQRWFMISIGATFFVLDIMLFMVKKLLSAEKARIITEHIEQLVFLISWVGTVCIYLIFINAEVYSKELPVEFVVRNQFAVAIAFLVGYYIVLFFSIKVGESVYIKQQNIELFKTIETEHQFRNAVINDAISVYEVNLSKNLLVKGFEDYGDMLAKFKYQYSLILKEMALKVIHPNDVAMFISHASLENLFGEYYDGSKETELVYRRVNGNGNYIWVKGTTNLYVDNATGDIKAFAYVKNIHEGKLLEIELKNKAERDSLTNLYNKGTIEKLISDFLNAKAKYMHNGALFIIDVDNFKMVNDTLGHSFGDKVLCDLSEKLKNIFRNPSEMEDLEGREDIIGRVGGDEFMIFIKNTTSKDILINKAESICKAFNNTYKSDNNVEITISSSIGISVFPKNGTCFDELYKGADVALYISKSKGKNVYSFYNGEKFAGYESKRGIIESVDE
ncbi:MAG: GGDEF domain-containing protein [Lachnospiraceae bacterium]